MKTFVAILMGSQSDLEVMSNCQETLSAFGIASEMQILSAHRTPLEVQEYIEDAQTRGCKVFIAGAGMAAHLAGAIAAHTTKPVIGVPLNASLQGLDSLLATSQMPAGIPVATVAIGSAGAKNAAYLAAQILALSDEKLAQRVKEERVTQRKKVLAHNEQLQKQLALVS